MSRRHPANMQGDHEYPPADSLTTNELYHHLNRLLPGATSTALVGSEWTAQHDCGVPRSWIIQAHKEARRRRLVDDGDKHMEYHFHSDREILESLSVKLDLDLFLIDEAADGEVEALVSALYTGLNTLEKPKM